MARGETEYQGKLLEARQNDYKDEFVLVILSAPIIVLAWAVFSDDPAMMDKIRQFKENYYGEKGAQKPNQTNEEYFEDFLTFKRAKENNTLNMSGMIDWIRTASPEERENFVDVYIDIENNLPNFYEKGGGSVGSALFDYLFYTVVDPIVLLGGVFGKMFSRGAMLAVKETLKKKGRDAALKEAKKIIKTE